MPKLDIAIAGAGPAGLAAALALHRDGHKVRVFERFETARPIGSGLMLQPTGQAMLGELGLLEPIRALGHPLDRLIGHDARSGRVVLDMSYAKLPGLGRGLGIHRAALFDVLHHAVVAAGIEVATGQTITGSEPGWLRFGANRSGYFDLVVDAMGSASPLRRALNVWFAAPSGGKAVSGILSGYGCYVTGNGVARVQFFLDTVPLNTDDTMADGMQCVLDTTRFANGRHSLKATAFDAAGKSRSDTISIRIRN